MGTLAVSTHAEYTSGDGVPQRGVRRELYSLDMRDEFRLQNIHQLHTVKVADSHSQTAQSGSSHLRHLWGTAHRGPPSPLLAFYYSSIWPWWC